MAASICYIYYRCWYKNQLLYEHEHIGKVSNQIFTIIIIVQNWINNYEAWQVVIKWILMFNQCD